MQKIWGNVIIIRWSISWFVYTQQQAKAKRHDIIFCWTVLERMNYCQENQGMEFCHNNCLRGMVFLIPRLWGWWIGKRIGYPRLHVWGEWGSGYSRSQVGGEYPRSHVQGMGGVPYHVTYPMIQIMSPTPHGQTHACENITFSKLPLRTVITFS